MSQNFPETRVCKGRPLRAQLWRNDVTVDYSAGDVEVKGRGDRKEITEFSKASLKQLCFVAHNTAVRFELMVTLTYPDKWETDGKEVKRHLREWLKWAKKDCGLDAYLWALEFQGRGAPHYHVFTKGGCLIRSKQACSMEWYLIVGSEDIKHLGAGTKVERLRKPDAAGRYAAKYAGKTWQKAVPPDYRNVGRFWGNSYNVLPEPLAERPLSGWGDLITEFEDWEYAERLKQRKPIGVLYNAGKFLQEKPMIEDYYDLVACWECGEVLDPGECMSIAYIHTEQDFKGDEHDEVRYAPVCNSCYVAITEKGDDRDQ